MMSSAIFCSKKPYMEDLSALIFRFISKLFNAIEDSNIFKVVVIYTIYHVSKTETNVYDCTLNVFIALSS